jgi:hypothetical protein
VGTFGFLDLHILTKHLSSRDGHRLGTGRVRRFPGQQAKHGVHLSIISASWHLKMSLPLSLGKTPKWGNHGFNILGEGRTLWPGLPSQEGGLETNLENSLFGGRFCGGHISPRSTRRQEGLAKGPGPLFRKAITSWARGGTFSGTDQHKDGSTRAHTVC